MISGIINNRIAFLMIVVERRQKEAVLSVILEKGARCLSLAYGRTDIEQNYLREATGFTPDENRLIITCLLANEKADETLQTLEEKFKFSQLEASFAFTTPIERVSY